MSYKSNSIVFNHFECVLSYGKNLCCLIWSSEFCVERIHFVFANVELGSKICEHFHLDLMKLLPPKCNNYIKSKIKNFKA